ncbi:MAG: hypothetical protein JXB24_13665 [Bacteroidales bacterium]|jgi:hypothetical protein|nr:hypothetical protein [Bacteroidales bacterium]
MCDNMENKKRRSGLKEQMLVIVNMDWNRAYVASINALRKHNDKIQYSAKCKLTDSFIVGIARNKKQLSKCMNDMATLVEEYMPGKLPADTYLIAGTNWIPN